jgi:hypothetical protein
MVYKKPDDQIKTELYLKNRDKIKERVKQYQEKNRDKLKLYNQEYYKKNREKIREKQNARNRDIAMGIIERIKKPKVVKKQENEDADVNEIIIVQY